MDRYEDNLNKYLYLVELQVTKHDKGNRLFNEHTFDYVILDGLLVCQVLVW